MKKNAQIQSQVFIYILSIVIISMIFLFGYRSISNIMSKAEEVELAELKIGLQESVDRISYDSSTNKNLMIPSRFTKICFVNTKNPSLNLPSPGDENHYPLMIDAANDGTANVFLIENKVTKEMFHIGKISLKTPVGDDADYLCKSTLGGKITINILGKGDHVEIKFVD